MQIANNQLFQGGPQQPIVSPLSEAVQQTATEYINNLVRMGQMMPIDGTNTLQMLLRYIPNIVGQLSSQYVNSVPYQAIHQIVANYVNQIIGQSRQQQPQQPMYAPPQQQPQFNQAFQQRPINNVLDGGFSTNRQSNQQQPEITQTPVIQVPQAPAGINLVKRVSESHQYQFTRDSDATLLSTVTETGPIISVKDKITITEDTGVIYNYCEAVCHIPEPSIRYVINNFRKTNPRLCTGRYIASLDYTRFILRAMKARTCGTINTNHMLAEERRNLPVKSTIHNVLCSIKERDFAIVSVMEELIVRVFNDRLERYARSTNNIKLILKVTELDDIETIADMREREFGDIQYHQDYEEVIFRCFKDAVESVITDLTKNGFYNTLDIVTHMLACPNFVIRDNGLCEREMDIDDKSFTAAVEARYTAFAANDSIVIANFIPEELEEDLEGNVIQIEKITTPFDNLIVSSWKNKPKTIIMTEGDRTLVVKNGVTLTGVPFIYKSSVDLDYGCEFDK